MTVELEARKCPFCHQEELVDVHEVWVEDRSFMLETCCEQSYAWLIEVEIPNADRKEWEGFFAEQAGLKVRTVAPNVAGFLTLDYGLELGGTTLQEAKEFVRANHRHNKPPCGWKWGHAVRNGGELVGVAMVGRTGARFKRPEDKGKKDAKWKPDPTIVEVNRCCVRPMDPKELVWNACSMLYGAAAREAKKRGYRKIITYIRSDEEGVSLRAVGWTLVDEVVRARSWDRAKRRRVDKAEIMTRRRWEKVL